jgi:hypothetical protein
MYAAQGKGFRRPSIYTYLASRRGARREEYADASDSRRRRRTQSQEAAAKRCVRGYGFSRGGRVGCL